ncbi:beta strand repeat-containing protein [Ideonella alba]|uniref:Calcium-binding protein n=1 Tax=Ideonella alba TaxID=2824118 RepID=A0A941BDL1_9BURK|nr:calcium-binding protein [Ideonella alba]MBQ0933105.1 hypothetical protein [Ideonella alba]
MATLTAENNFNPLVQVTWTVFRATGTASWFEMEDSVKHQTFLGSFTYPDATHVKGVVNEIRLWSPLDPTQGFTISGLAADAAAVQTKVVAGAGLYSYLLSGNDTISGGLRQMGFAGNDVMQPSTKLGGMVCDGGDGSDTAENATSTGMAASLLTQRMGLPGSQYYVTLVNIEHLRGGYGSDTLTGNAGDNRLDGNLGIDTVSYDGVTTAVNVNLATGVATGHGRDTLVGIENITGTRQADVLTGDGLGNVLNGGLGADTMSGGLGNDTYIVDASDVVTEAANAGIDTLVVATDWTLSRPNIENLQLTGAALRGTGDAGANRITGNDLANVLDGKAGVDTLVGGKGNDSYLVDVSGDIVIEALNEGTDTVTSLVTRTLGANLENLVLGGSAAINGTGNNLSNSITGNAAANVLSVGAAGGLDTLTGGGGNDQYLLGHAHWTTVVEAANGGYDSVTVSYNYTLTANVEALTLTGSEAITGVGNSLNNAIVGNTGANTLNGGAGNDTLKGGLGADVYIVDSVLDVVVELAGQGYDRIEASASCVMGDNIETLTLVGGAGINGTGNAAANSITGNSGNNRLNGGGGADTMSGGAGNDTYVVDNAGDRIMGEDTAGGVDTVETGLSWTLQRGLENLLSTGSASVSLTGNDVANRLTGNAGNNLIDGGAGNDTMTGGAGNDTYRVSGPQDVVVEVNGGGTDTVVVVAGGDYTLSAFVENLTGSGRLTGNALANQIVGGSGNDTINGGAGADRMEGGSGDDTYYVDNVGDVIIDAWGLSTICSSISYTAGPNIHALIKLQGSANLNATIEAYSGSIWGNSGNNTLTCAHGGGGELYGGAGNDTYVIGANMRVWENGGDGYDIVQTVDCGFNLDTYCSIEEIRLGNGNFDARGNLSSNLLLGGSGNNRLDGGAGLDTASFSNAASGVNVDMGAGTAVGFGNDTLVNIEAVIGSAWADTLRGGDGADTLTGGAGADTFVVDNLLAADLITDFSGGQDLLQFVQAGWSIGNGDAVVDGGVAISGPGGFSAAAELVVVDTAITGDLTATAAAAAIGSATEDYTVGQTALFVVHNANEAAVFLFTSGGTNPIVDAAELTRLCTLDHGLVNLNNIGFITG